MDKMGRVIIDPPLSGPRNMAVDEAMLLAAGQVGKMTLRLYRWDKPTISLGCFQCYQQRDQLDPALQALPIVRRITGGGAILHDLEITYSIIIPPGHWTFSLPASATYRLVHGALIQVIAQLGISATLRDKGNVQHDSRRGPFFCFAREHATDVIAGGEKLIGSAQRRTKGGILQHGSIILQSRFPQQRCASIEQLTGQEISGELLERQIVQALGAGLKVQLIPGRLTDHELSAAADLQARYAGDQWTIRRSWPARTDLPSGGKII